MSATNFILSSVCIGFANTCIEWFIIGFLFHKFQGLTPKTWKQESNRSYMYSTLLSFLFGVLFTFFYLKIGSKYVLAGSIWSHIKLGLICFACFSFVLEVGNAIYINYDKKFVAGKLNILECLWKPSIAAKMSKYFPLLNSIFNRKKKNLLKQA